MLPYETNIFLRYYVHYKAFLVERNSARQRPRCGDVSGSYR